MSTLETAPQKGDDLHFKNGRIWDSAGVRFRKGELVLTDGRIEQITFGGTSVIEHPRDTGNFDLKGGYLSPAFFDGHMHLSQWSISRSGVDLSRCRSAKEVLSTIEKVIDGREGNILFQMTGTVFGTDLDDSLFPSGQMLDSRSLEGDMGDVPIIIRRICGHKAVANHRGMEELDLSDDRSDDGILLEEMAMSIPWKLPIDEGVFRGLYAGAVNELYRHGVVGGVDIIPLSEYDRIMELLSGPTSPFRSTISIIRDTSAPINIERESSTIGAEGLLPPVHFEKFFLDGSIGARTASFERDYIDAPKFPLLHSDDELIQRAERSYDDGLVPMVHCIGDAAISQAIRVFEGLGGPYRLEHAEAITDEQLRQMKGGNGGLCLQPNFQHIWGREGGLYENALGTSSGLNRFRTVLGSGVPWCFGTDMMPPSVMFAFKGGIEHPTPSERLSLSEMVQGFSIRSEKMSLVGSQNGQGMKIGSYPDLTAFDRDLASVSATVIAGRLVFGGDHLDS